jgi:hypothetical protein
VHVKTLRGEGCISASKATGVVPQMFLLVNFGDLDFTFETPSVSII